jgi:hypothetical protein
MNIQFTSTYTTNALYRALDIFKEPDRVNQEIYYRLNGRPKFTN